MKFFLSAIFVFAALAVAGCTSATSPTALDAACERLRAVGAQANAYDTDLLSPDNDVEDFLAEVYSAAEGPEELLPLRQASRLASAAVVDPTSPSITVDALDRFADYMEDLAAEMAEAGRICH